MVFADIAVLLNTLSYIHHYCKYSGNLCKCLAHNQAYIHAVCVILILSD